jgi:hypothetical protein
VVAVAAPPPTKLTLANQRTNRFNPDGLLKDVVDICRGFLAFDVPDGHRKELLPSQCLSIKARFCTKAITVFLALKMLILRQSLSHKAILLGLFSSHLTKKA